MYNNISEEKKYWKSKLDKDIVLSRFPYDKIEAKINLKKEATKICCFGDDIYRNLYKLSNGSDYAIYVILVASISYLLSRYNSSEDITIGIPLLNQYVNDEDTLIPLRIEIKNEYTLKDLLQHVKLAINEAYEYGTLNYHDIMRLLDINKDTDDFRMKTVVAYENINKVYFEDADTAFVFKREGEKLNLSVKYNSSFYSGEIIEQIINELGNFIFNILMIKDQILQEVEIVTEEEKYKLLEEFNDTDADYPRDKTINDIFEYNAKLYPGRIALSLGNNSLTYEVLNKKVNQLAASLRKNGVKRESIVAIMIEPSFNMIIGILAILKAGGAYLPIDPGYPVNRIEYTLKDSQTKILLVSNQYEGISNFDGTVINIDNEDLYKEEANIRNINEPTDLAYIIYTSGTTGNPKGVMIQHNNVIRLITNSKMQFDFDENDVWTMFHSFCFDFSVWEMYGALLYGGKLVLVPRIKAKDTRAFLKILQEEKVTVLNQTPTAFNALLGEELQDEDPKLNIRFIIFGGEALKPVMLKEWKDRYPNTKLINMYGITETTVHVTYKEITDYEIDNNISNIGKPIPTLKTYIMDKNLKLLPIGVEGELCVAGDGVGRGYLNKIGLTSEKFVSNPYNEEEKLYRSGDLGKILSNGEIEYIGRRDNQVKIRGFRIEIGEIEANILKYENIKNAVVIHYNDNGGDSLCAYVVTKQSISITEIRKFLSISLPEYMIPAYFIEVDNIPMTSNGKIDKKALPIPNNNFISNSEYIEPRNEIECSLVNIFNEEMYISIRQLGINEDFFELGGDSIKALKIINRINKEFNIELQISDLYKCSKIIDLAEFIGEKLRNKDSEQNNKNSEYIEKFRKNILQQGILNTDEVEDFYELSDIQFGMIYHSITGSNKFMYHDQFIYQLKIKDFSYENLLNALNLMIRKHEILRVNYNLTDFSVPIQIIYKDLDFDLQYEDISTLDLENQEIIIKQYVSIDKDTPFELEKPCKKALWRIKTFYLGDNDIALVWSFHHSILDGWSCASFISELFQLYKKICKNEDIKIERLKNDYKKFILQQKEIPRDEEIIQYWKDELKNYKKLKLSQDTSDKFDSKVVYYNLPIELIDRLTQVNKYYKTDYKTTYFAAYLYMLNMISYETDIVVGLVEHNRPVCEDGDKILGCFLNTIPVRMNFDKEITCGEFIKNVKNKLIDIKHYGKMPLVEIIKTLDESTSEDNGIFETIFNYIDFHVLEKLNDQVSAINKLNIDNYEKTNTIFDFTVSNTFSNCQVKITYREVDFTEDQIKKLLNYFIRILEMFTSDLDATLGKDKILSLEEKQELLTNLNNTEADFPNDKTIHDFFEEQVEKNPDKIAAIFKEEIITYKELNEKANQLARVLRNKGIGRDSIVAIMVQRSFEMLIGIFGILKAGGAYLPIDPSYPQDRIKYIIDDSNVKVLISNNENYRKYSFNTEVINLNDEYISKEDKCNLPIINDSKDLAYVIYTSGSTGRPKGTLIEHQSLINRLNWMQKEYPISERDVILQKTTYTFDVSVWELFWWSMIGATVCMLIPDGEKDPQEIIKAIYVNKVTTMHFVPSMLNIFLEYLGDKENLHKTESLSRIFCSGEALQVYQVKKFNEIFREEKAELINLYGPTEATIDVSYFNCIKGKNYNLIPIGRPIDNTKFFVINKNGELQPKGAYGELCISGVGLARGYLNNNKLTNEKFVNSKFEDGIKMYKTGDFVRWLPDGNIEYINRIDNQVKIRGLRIELGEIENEILNYKDIKDAAVVTKTINNQQYICAYFCAKDNIVVDDLKAFLLLNLPQYMVPNYFVQVEKMPLSHNGKLDRKSLPLPKLNENIGKKNIEPCNETEEKLQEIWKDALKLDRISVLDNIFEIGGHSLLIAIIILKVNESFGINVKIKDLYKNPSIRLFGEYINQIDKNDSPYKSIQLAQKLKYYNTTSSQKRIFIMNEIEGDNLVYNMPYGFKIKGDLDKEKLEKAFNDVVEHQQSLRTTFQFSNGILMQKVNENVKLNLKCIEATNTEVDEAIKKFIKPFNLTEDLLIRCELIKIDKLNHILLVDMHHIISDGISIDIFLKDLFDSYLDKKLRKLEVQYTDYSMYCNELLNDKNIIDKQEKYWMDVFSGEISELVIPTDYHKVQMNNYEGKRITSRIEGELLQQARKLAETQGTTMYSLLFAAYYILLKDYTNQDDIAIGTGISSRNNSKLLDVIGMFINTFSIRNYPKDDKKIKVFVKEVTDSILGAYENQDYPFEELVKKLNIPRKSGRIPLQNTIFVYRRLEENLLNIKNLEIEIYDLNFNILKNDMYISCIDKSDYIEVSFEYSPSLFKQNTIEKLSNKYTEILAKIIENIDEEIGNIVSQEKYSQIDEVMNMVEEEISFEF